MTSRKLGSAGARPMSSSGGQPRRTTPRNSSLDRSVDRHDHAQSEHGVTSWLRIVEVGLSEALLANREEREAPPRGALFAAVISSRIGTKVVAVVGRPVPPRRDDGFTLEITRIRADGSISAEVAIYRAVWQLIRLRGYRRLITHTEMGAIRRGLMALGLTPVAAVPPRSPSACPATAACRPRRRWRVPGPVGDDPGTPPSSCAGLCVDCRGDPARGRA